ncbi:hypothetical protein [Nocardioides sp.]|uniref:hypothetical protein n=1 Tax=Nocardioides sp. TaxID=35761 RepID=UPI003511C4F7
MDPIHALVLLALLALLWHGRALRRDAQRRADLADIKRRAAQAELGLLRAEQRKAADTVTQLRMAAATDPAAPTHAWLADQYQRAGRTLPTTPTRGGAA